MNRKQLTVFFVMLAVYALCAFITYVFLLEQMSNGANIPLPVTTMSPLVMGLANAGIVLVAYGLLGLAGYWFACEAGAAGHLQRGWELAQVVLGADGPRGALRADGDRR